MHDIIEDNASGNTLNVFSTINKQKNKNDDTKVDEKYHNNDKSDDIKAHTHQWKLHKKIIKLVRTSLMK